jgi:hypothetical protein
MKNRMMLTALISAAFALPVDGQGTPLVFGGPGRSIELVRYDQADFETAIDVGYPGLRQEVGFDSVKPFLCILRNHSGHGINAFVLRWEVIESDGRRMELTRSPWAGASAGGTLTGERPIWKQGEDRLISPSFDWGATTSGHESRAKLISAMLKGRLVPSSSAVLRIDVWLDAVVYDDGVFVGPDQSGFYNRFECQQEGEQDEAAFVVGMLDLNFSDESIAAGLKADVEKQRGQDAGDKAALVDAARAQEAQILLAVLNRSGRAGLKNIALRIRSAQRTVLQRQ